MLEGVCLGKVLPHRMGSWAWESTVAPQAGKTQWSILSSNFIDAFEVQTV